MTPPSSEGDVEARMFCCVILFVVGYFSPWAVWYFTEVSRISIDDMKSTIKISQKKKGPPPRGGEKSGHGSPHQFFFMGISLLNSSMDSRVLYVSFI